MPHLRPATAPRFGNRGRRSPAAARGWPATAPRRPPSDGLCRSGSSRRGSFPVGLQANTQALAGAEEPGLHRRRGQTQEARDLLDRALLERRENERRAEGQRQLGDRARQLRRSLLAQQPLAGLGILERLGAGRGCAPAEAREPARRTGPEGAPGGGARCSSPDGCRCCRDRPRSAPPRDIARRPARAGRTPPGRALRPGRDRRRDAPGSAPADRGGARPGGRTPPTPLRGRAPSPGRPGRRSCRGRAASRALITPTNARRGFWFPAGASGRRLRQPDQTDPHQLDVGLLRLQGPCGQRDRPRIGALLDLRHGGRELGLELGDPAPGRPRPPLRRGRRRATPSSIARPSGPKMAARDSVAVESFRRPKSAPATAPKTEAAVAYLWAVACDFCSTTLAWARRTRSSSAANFGAKRAFTLSTSASRRRRAWSASRTRNSPSLSPGFELRPSSLLEKSDQLLGARQEVLERLRPALVALRPGSPRPAVPRSCRPRQAALSESSAGLDRLRNPPSRPSAPRRRRSAAPEPPRA